MKRIRDLALGTALALSAVVFQGCPLSGILADCFDEDTISRQEFEDLNSFEQLLYDENDCGRFEPVSDLLDPLL